MNKIILAALVAVIAVVATAVGTANAFVVPKGLPIPTSTQQQILRTERTVFPGCKVVMAANTTYRQPRVGARMVWCGGAVRMWGYDSLPTLQVTRPSANRLSARLEVAKWLDRGREAVVKATFDLKTRRLVGQAQIIECRGFTRRNCEELRTGMQGTDRI